MVAVSDSDSASFSQLMQRLLSLVDALLSSGLLGNNRKLSAFLALMEHSLGFVSPQIAPPGVQTSSNLAGLMSDQTHCGSLQADSIWKEAAEEAVPAGPNQLRVFVWL